MGSPALGPQPGVTLWVRAAPPLDPAVESTWEPIFFLFFFVIEFRERKSRGERET